MRLILLLASFIWTTTSVGQSLKKGIYKGQKFPFTICYLSLTDSTIEVEYFFQKSGQIFGHLPVKKLKLGTEHFSKKASLKSLDDSIKVFAKADYFLIKRKGFGRIKVHKSVETETTIAILRNRNRLFSFSHDLYDEFKVKPDFDQQKFTNKFGSYKLDEYLNLDSAEFNKKLDETRDDIIKNWL